MNWYFQKLEPETDRNDPEITKTDARAFPRELKSILKKGTPMNEDDENIGEIEKFRETRMESPVEIEMVDMAEPFG